MPTHPWTFRPRFRRNAFGWRSQPAMQRIKEAVAEIKDVATHDPALAAEGAVLLIEKLSPALERVDSSSGAIGGTVNRAIAELTAIIGAARAETSKRPKFAVQAGLAALRWQVEGHGYKAVANDGRLAFAITIRAAEAAGEVEAVRAQVREWVENPPRGRTGWCGCLRSVRGDVAIERIYSG
ncbi:hypothetical protein [Lujinxingia litoralis]|uniref:hypothetical protein n=1 Tax=Lujinxingia litoralis TaxID=2211119 RepID=UPI0018F479C2|nr:hypothetical protein [Lujinxingia litoralis]